MASDPPGRPSEDGRDDGAAAPARPEDRDRLARLDARLAAARKAGAGEGRGDEHYSQANQAWRMVTEMVAGLGIGFGIGYGLDVLFGTLPVLMVIFTLLGLVAGVKTMMRTADEMGRAQGGKGPPGERAGGAAPDGAGGAGAGTGGAETGNAADAAKRKQAEDTAGQKEGR